MRKALACVARMKGSYSASLVAKVLTGSDDKTVRAFGFSSLSTYGILSDWTKAQVLDLLTELVRAGALEKTHVTREIGGRERTYAEIGISRLGAEVMMQRAPDFVMVFPERRRKKSRSKKKPSAPAPAGSVPQDLLQALRDVRKDLAHRADVPLYVVAANRTLEDMAQRKPRSEQAMLEVHGMGPKRFKRYGKPFLEVIQGWTG